MRTPDEFVTWPVARERQHDASAIANAQLTRLIEALPAAVYGTDAAGRIIFFNKSAVKLWGRKPELHKNEWCGSWRMFRTDGSPMRHDECPMAVALRERRAIRGEEAVAERPDGTRVTYLAFPTPLYNDEGALIGGLNMLVDITRRKANEYAEQWLASIVESSDDAIMSKDLNSIIMTWNHGAERVFGYTADEVIGKPVTILTPPSHHNEEPEILDRIKRGETVGVYETIRQHKNGALIDVSLKVSPIKTSSGRVVGASAILHDITERKRAQERQELLVREMGHRVTNVLAVANGLVALSARTATDPKSMAKAVQERLAAFTRAHELTRPGLLGGDSAESQRSSLHTLIRTIVAPYADLDRVGAPSCVTIEGEDIAISGSTVTGLALVLHEFTTNAAKYGAFSSSSGSVCLTCSHAGDSLLLTWQERGGPTVEGPPQKEGFGSVLARRTVSGQFGGQLTYDWAPEGLGIRVRLPLERLV